jgi:hypothetical protein
MARTNKQGQGGEGAAAAAKSGEQQVTLAELPFDRYEIEVMDRRLLHGAPYNPRVMSDDEKRHLRAGLKKHGMLQPPIWNKRLPEKGWPEGSAGVLVGGHQRISQLDALNGSDKYTLKVAVVDLTDAEEKEANILLNNPSAQGDWDLEKLETLMRDPGLDMAGTGFDMAEVFRLFGDMPGAAQPEVEQLAQKLREFQEAYTKVSDNFGRDDFYAVVVFRDYATRTEFFRRLGLPDNRYQDGVRLLELLQLM